MLCLVKNIRKICIRKLNATDKRKNYLVPEPNYHSTKRLFSTKAHANKIKKTEVKMNIKVELDFCK